MKPVNLFSDTQTLPTAEMLEAMRTAPLGDDVMGTDPTVNRLQDMAAERLGKQAALFVPSGTMGNHVALMAAGRHGDEILVDPDAHVYYYENGGLCALAGLTPRPLPARHGVLDPAEVEAAIRPPSAFLPSPRILAVENTHNRGGGTVTPPETHRALYELARRHDLWLHLDGARIFNAAIALGVEARDLAACADSVMCCLSKGLSAPVGSLVLGPSDFIARCRRARQMLGGSMRQAGVIAAAGIVALDTMVDRLAEDHATARRLAEGVNRIEGLLVDLDRVQTNMLYVDVSGLGVNTEGILPLLRDEGLLASSRPPHHIRLVTHRHLSTEDVDCGLTMLHSVADRLRR